MMMNHNLSQRWDKYQSFKEGQNMSKYLKVKFCFGQATATSSTSRRSTAHSIRSFRASSTAQNLWSRRALVSVAVWLSFWKRLGNFQSGWNWFADPNASCAGYQAVSCSMSMLVCDSLSCFCISWCILWDTSWDVGRIVFCCDPCLASKMATIQARQKSDSKKSWRSRQQNISSFYIFWNLMNMSAKDSGHNHWPIETWFKMI